MMLQKTHQPSKDAPRAFCRLPFWVITGTLGLTLGFQSCTAIGLVGGASAATNLSTKSAVIQFSDLDVLKTSQLLQIKDKTGRTTKGNYMGLYLLPKDLYFNNYQTFRNQIDKENDHLPEMNEVILIHFADSSAEKDVDSVLLFKGFGAGSIFVSNRNGDSMNTVSLKGITSLIRSNGFKLSTKSIQNLIDEHKIPLRHIATLKSNNKLIDFPLDEVQIMRTFKGGKSHSELVLLGFGIGLAIDYLTIFKIFQVF